MDAIRTLGGLDGQENINPTLEYIARQVRTTPTLVNAPETAIDASKALSGGGYAISEFPQDLANKFYRTALENTTLYGPEAAEQGIARSLFQLTVGSKGIIREIMDSVTGLPEGLTEKEFFDRVIFNEKTYGREIYQRITDLIEVNSGSLGIGMIKTSDRSNALLRAFQLLDSEEGILSEGMFGNIGIDPTGAKLKLSVIPDDNNISDIQRTSKTWLETLKEIREKAARNSQEIPDRYNAEVSRLEEMIGVFDKEIARANNANTGGSKIREAAQAKLHSDFVEMNSYRGKALEKYATTDADSIIDEFVNFAKDFKAGNTKNARFNAYGDLTRIVETTDLNNQYGNFEAKLAAETPGITMEKRLSQLGADRNFLAEIDDFTAYDYQFTKNPQMPRYIDEVLTPAGITINKDLDGLTAKRASDLIKAHIQADQNRHLGAVARSMESTIGELTEEQTPAEFLKKMHIKAENFRDQSLDKKSSREASLANKYLGDSIDDAIGMSTERNIPYKGGMYSINEISELAKAEIHIAISNSVINEDILGYSEESMRTVFKELGEKLGVEQPHTVEQLRAMLSTTGEMNAQTGLLTEFPKLVDRENIDAILGAMGDANPDNITSSSLEELLGLSNEESGMLDIFSEKVRKDMVAEKGLIDDDLMFRAEAKIQAELRRDQVMVFRARKDAEMVATSELSTKTRAARAAANALAEARGETPRPSIDEGITSWADNWIRDEADEVGSATRDAISRSLGVTEGEAIGVYKRFNPKETAIIKAIMKNKGTTAGIAAIALGVGIFASIRKKEHTQQGVAGPPLIPGGNPYERIPAGSMSYPDAPGGSTEQMGTSYNVSVNGDSEQMREFSARAGLVTNGQVGSTMYNSLPDLGRDHYGDIAGSF